MNRKAKYYKQVKFLIEGLIALPETDRDEDHQLQNIHKLMSDMCNIQDEYEQQEEIQPPVPQMPEAPLDQTTSFDIEGSPQDLMRKQILQNYKAVKGEVE